MNIRWRLGICALELSILLWLSKEESGAYFSAKPWFAAAFALVLNGFLVEPFFPKPADVICNTVAFVVLAQTATNTYTSFAWTAGQSVCLIALLLATFAILAGNKQATGRLAALANSAKIISQIASARVIYSIAFFLSAIEAHPSLDRQFWHLAIGWGAFLLVGAVNWQRVWASASGQADFCEIEGMIGPSSLIINAPSLPATGSAVVISSNKRSVQGIVTGRIRRTDDTWGVVHFGEPADCELFVSEPSLTFRTVLGGAAGEAGGVIGAVDSGSTDRKISFIALRTLSVGTAVGVKHLHEMVLFQLTSAIIERLDVKGGGQLIVRATGVQLGIFDRKTLLLRDHRWVPNPGARVLENSALESCGAIAIPANSVLLGHLIGTDVPILLDLPKAREGHLAILGMTKMGKSTLATRLAHEMAKTACVVILDQTGEYVAKKGIPRCGMTWNGKAIGATVFEPKPGEIPAERALSFLKSILALGMAEYASGTPMPRVVIIDEAHQFIPEPAGMGFGAPGRDSSIEIGLLLMQVRKFGISVILISQRTAVVSKSALSQCENLIAFRSVDQTGVDYMEAIVGADAGMLLPKLRQAEALVFGPAISCGSAVVVNVAK